MTLRSDAMHEELSTPSLVFPLEFEEIGYTAVPEKSEALIDAFAGQAEESVRDVPGELEVKLQAQADQHARDMDELRLRMLEEHHEQSAREVEEAVLRERQAIARTCERFAQERTRYFAAVEEEVVRLSVAIAARILHRETGIDPLLLRGAIHVALEKVQGAETAVLRVPMEQVQDWQKILLEAHRDDVKVEGDIRLSAGDCMLETSVGRVDLGVRAQLEEIEKGFFDLLQQRPA